jgi:nucleoside-diphosphate-sugar epimerase
MTVAQTSLVILGSGYVARHLLPLAARPYARVFATSRKPETHLSYVSIEHRIRFDLDKPDTWQTIPNEADLLWCFPAEPLERVQGFTEVARASSRRIVVLGTTSAYDVDRSATYPPPWIDETAPIDLSKPRVQGEEFLRIHCGAIVLRVAGIYGPGRNPLDWITSGRVGPSRKFVNLVHVEDLAVSGLAALRRGVPGTIYNVSDGTPRTWEEICETAKRRWNIHPFTEAGTSAPGKRLSNQRLQELLSSDRETLRHPDLYEALARIQRGVLSEAAP